MAGINLNDTVGLLIRLLNHHREIIDVWHRLTALLQRLGLISSSPAAQVDLHSSHAFDVRWVQSSLNTLMNAGLQVDGIMGPLTIEAVKRYQQRSGLEPDGWVGVLTLAQLEKDMAGRG